MKLFSLFLLLFISIQFSMCTNNPNDSLVLHSLVRQPKIKSDNPPLLILLHGVGSNEDDLFSFANQLPDQFLVVSARAPFTITEGSYKWYEINFSNGKPTINKEEAEKSRILLNQYIEQLKTEYAIKGNNVYLCGFSQGAIMSFSIGLTNPKSIKGIIALSGRMLDEINPLIAKSTEFLDFQALVIHGTQDDVLPIQNARNSQLKLNQLGIKFDYHELPMGHTVSTETLQLINEWLKNK